MVGSSSQGTHAVECSAIIVSHGQPSDPVPAEDELAALSLRVASYLPGWQINSATLAGPGALDRALAETGSRPFIYPLFMTDGWFVHTALPRRLGDTEFHILPPLGAEPELPGLVASNLKMTLKGRGWDAGETCLLVASHGSGRSPNSRRSTETFVDDLKTRIEFAEIRTGYIEEAPRLGDVVIGCPRQTLCLPFFAAYGGHVKEDIAEALGGVNLKNAQLAPIGTLEVIPELISESLRNAVRARVE